MQITLFNRTILVNKEDDIRIALADSEEERTLAAHYLQSSLGNVESVPKHAIALVATHKNKILGASRLLLIGNSFKNSLSINDILVGVHHFPEKLGHPMFGRELLKLLKIMTLESPLLKNLNVVINETYKDYKMATKVNAIEFCGIGTLAHYKGKGIGSLLQKSRIIISGLVTKLLNIKTSEILVFVGARKESKNLNGINEKENSSTKGWYVFPYKFNPHEIEDAFGKRWMLSASLDSLITGYSSTSFPIKKLIENISESNIVYYSISKHLSQLGLL